MNIGHLTKRIGRPELIRSKYLKLKLFYVRLKPEICFKIESKCKKYPGLNAS
jgi:hypothetical protein